MSTAQFAKLLENLRSAVGKSQEVHRANSANFEDWHRREMEDLLALINWERAVLRKDPITMVTLLSVESLASGHSDYSLKLALYATEIILYDRYIPQKDVP